jgi:hypothetical protein
VTLLPNVIVCCCILHNTLLGQTLEEVDQLLSLLQREGMAPAVDDNPPEDNRVGPENAEELCVDQKRADLASYVVRQRA